MIAFLPALLLFLMQGGVPAEALEARLTAELWLQIQGRQASASTAFSITAAPQAEDRRRTLQRGPLKPFSRLAKFWGSQDAALPSGPILCGDRSRDGPRAG
jgi:hypothetical protein